MNTMDPTELAFNIFLGIWLCVFLVFAVRSFGKINILDVTQLLQLPWQTFFYFGMSFLPVGVIAAMSGAYFLATTMLVFCFLDFQLLSWKVMQIDPQVESG